MGFLLSQRSYWPMAVVVLVGGSSRSSGYGVVVGGCAYGIVGREKAGNWTMETSAAG